MSNYSLTATDSIVSNIVRRAPDGAITISESNRDDYTVPPEGEYEWEITGFAEPFEMARSVEFGGGVQMKTRLEFTILSGKGQGRKFTQMFTWSVGAKSTLGQLIGKLRGAMVAVGEEYEMTTLLGAKAKSYVSHAVDKQLQLKLKDGKPAYAEISVKTVRPLLPTDPALASDADWE